MSDLIYNWRVRIYLADDDSEVVEEWVILQHTERAATVIAAASVASEYPSGTSWTMDRFFVERCAAP